MRSRRGWTGGWSGWGGEPWTVLFGFRPTWELVAREVFGAPAAEVPRLAYVEPADRTFGTRTRYRPTL
ncbi:hypothetical protein [Symbioplanes lichenis]|uniref:hypothetical protein n=1 Tax=Symbioplanes lichenis TaxID=1629072 RepID=UPI00273A00DE|nr:hypothetical protein [Actinoplanes lichenis]